MKAAIASVISIISFDFCAHAGFAQTAIAPDATLPINTTVNFNSANKTYTITGGTQVGVNQFHSFQDFSVPTGNTAHFDTVPTIVNAIGRVTGSNVSNIDGILRTNGATNLYLVNPNGIIFGANAKLDIAGSFSASTANSIKFSDGSEFSATNPQAPPLLQVNMPLGLQYGNSNAGATIVNLGNLSAGQDLVLNADKLDLQGILRSGRDLTLQAQDLVKIRDTVANPFVANSGRDLTIQGNNSIDIFVLNNPLTQILSGRHLSLVSDGVISGDAHFLSGGNLSFLTTVGGVANFVSKYDPIIYANGDVTFGDYTGAALKVEATGSIQTGNIRITSPDCQAGAAGCIGGIPSKDPDFVTLTTLPSVILRAGVTSVNSNIPQTTGGTTFSSTTLGNPAGSITFGSIDTSSYTGDGGVIELTAKGDIKANNRSALNSSSSSSLSNAGNGGAISLSTITGDISFNAPVSSGSYSFDGNAGNGGAISLSTITGDISFNASVSSGSSSIFGNAGNGGAISLSTITGDISLNYSINGSSLSSGSYSNYGNVGNGGAISLSTITGDISLNYSILNSNSFSNSGNAGNSGAISLSTITGDISLNSSRLDSYSFSNSGNTGNGGDIILSAIKGNILGTGSSSIYSFSVSNTPDLTSGAGGNVTLSAKNLINNIEFVTASSSGRAGKATINGFGDLTISGLQVSTSKTVSILNPVDGSTITFEVATRGRSGDVTVTGLGSLTFDNTIINSATQGSDPAGNISITSPSLITFQNNSQIKSTTNSTGNAGNISFTTGNLLLTDGVTVSASTAGSGKAGDISVKANNFTISNGASIQTKTFSSGDSGKIEVIVGNNLILVGAGTGLFADTAKGSSGNGGNINIDPQLVLLKDGAKIAVGSLGSGIGGNITIASNFLTLLNASSITAETASTNGGNINLNIPSILLLRYGSQISTTAGTSLAGGNGGNINITAGFIVALPKENSDIFANAFTGNGGNVNITTNGIFGLAFRPTLTSLSDITASSQFGVQGNVNLSTPGVDPSQGLNNLPADISDASKLVAQKCLADRQGSSFVITGRGGVPASPFDTISAANILDHLGSISNQTASNTSNRITAESSNPPIPDRIVEAQGWMINQQGQVSLMAEVPKATPAPTWARQLQCR